MNVVASSDSALSKVRSVATQPHCEPGSALRWIVAQEGSREAYGVPLGFHHIDRLRLLYVDTWCRWGRWWLRRGPKPCRAFATHYNPGLPAERVISFNGSMLLSRAAFHL